MFSNFLYILTLVSFTSLIANPREEKRKQENEIHSLLKDSQYEELIPKLERYIQKYPYEKKYQLYLAKAYFLKPISDLERNEDAFKWEEKRNRIFTQYKKAQAIYSQVILEWENLFPNEPNLGNWYFEWALLEHILGNKQRAISLYKKSSQFHEFPKETFYNSGILFLELGLEKEAYKQLKKYYSYEKAENL